MCEEKMFMHLLGGARGWIRDNAEGLRSIEKVFGGGD